MQCHVCCMAPMRAVACLQLEGRSHQGAEHHQGGSCKSSSGRSVSGLKDVKGSVKGPSTVQVKLHTCRRHFRRCSQAHLSRVTIHSCVLSLGTHTGSQEAHIQFSKWLMWWCVNTALVTVITLYLTIPVRPASAQQSLSKLRLIKKSTWEVQWGKNEQTVSKISLKENCKNINSEEIIKNVAKLIARISEF